MKLFSGQPRAIAMGFVLIASWLRAGSLPAALPKLPRATPPLPSVVALASTRHIPLEGFDPSRESPALRTGDAVSILFTLLEHGHEQQWLAEVKVVPLTDQERQAKPAEAVIYSGSGNEFHLASASAAFALHMFGPFSGETTTANPPAIPEKDARFTMKEDFLGFGFDRMCEVALRLRLAGRQINLGFTTGPFSKEDIIRGKQWVREAGFTPEDELICAKQGFATVEFLGLAQHTPGFRDIAQASVELPSFWSAVRKMNFGLFFNHDWKKLTRIDGTAQGLSAPVYALPFGLTMFGSHIADGEWLVTEARPPLLTCAGVIGLTVTPPENKDKRLEMRVIAARNAPP